MNKFREIAERLIIVKNEEGLFNLKDPLAIENELLFDDWYEIKKLEREFLYEVLRMEKLHYHSHFQKLKTKGVDKI